MATVVTWNGTSYTIPGAGDENWAGANKVDGLLISLATNGFQKSGGTFTLSADADFGVSAGLKSLYFKTRSSNIATTGNFRLANADVGVVWRNAANSADLPLTVNASNVLSYNGVGFLSTTGGLTVGGNTTGDSNLGTIASVTLSQYYQGSFSMTFTGPFTADQTVTVSYVKIGRMVMLSIPSVVAAASVVGSGQIASTANLPTGLDPAASTMYEIPIRDNSAVQTNPGKIQTFHPLNPVK